MSACEGGHIDMIEAIIEGAEDDKRVKMLGYICESGSPLHAAITG